MGGEMAEMRDAGGAEMVKTEEKRMRPVLGADGFGACDVDDVERSLAKFAEVAASSPNIVPKIPAELDGVLREISTVGVPYYGWGQLKELLAARMAEAVGTLERESGFRQTIRGKDYAQRRNELLASLRNFDAAPFTLQRLAEVLQDPRRQYSSTHKLINGLERLLAVSSTLPIRARKGVPRTSSTSSFTAAKDGPLPSPTPRDATAVAVASTTSNGVAHPNRRPSPTSTSAEEEEEANRGGSITTAAGAAVTVGVGVGVVGVSISASIKTEPVSASSVPGEAALVPVDEKSIVEENPDAWQLEGSNGARGQGRKRLKVAVKTEAPAMSE